MKILTLGSTVIDTYLFPDKNFNEVRLGDKVKLNLIKTSVGGGAINTAHCMSKLGCIVELVSKHGDENILNEHISGYKNHAKAVKGISDRSYIITSNKDRIIYNHKNLSSKLDLSDFPKKSYDGVYLATLTGKSFTNAITFLKSKKFSKVCFNPSLYLCEKNKLIYPILKSIDILILNVEELKVLSGENSVKKSFKKLIGLGCKNIIATNGRKKMFSTDSINLYSFTPPDVEIVHTAGAGDCFASTFFVYFLKNYSFMDCLRMAQLNSSSIIQHFGTHHKLLTHKQLLNLSKKLPFEIKESIFR